MSLWDTIFGKPAAPGSQGGPPRQVMPPRLINTSLINPFASNFGNGNDLSDFQKSVYFFPGGNPDPAGGQTPLRDNLVDPFPVWIGVDLQMGPLKTARGHFPIPANFWLLSFFASSSSNVNGGFKVVVYDNNRRLPITLRPVDFNTLAGTGNSPLFLRVPYLLNPAGNDVKVKWTASNLETVTTNNVQFGLFGTQAIQGDPTQTSLAKRIAAALRP